MASNETSKYKLSVVEGTELQLSLNGAQGPAGSVGPAGPTGGVGPAGADGADALWNYTGEYNVGASYAVGDVATYGGETFYRTDAHGGNTGDTPSNVSLYWDLLAAKGEDGGGGDALPLAGGAMDADATITLDTTPDGNDNYLESVVSGGGFSAKQYYGVGAYDRHASINPSGITIGRSTDANIITLNTDIASNLTMTSDDGASTQTVTLSGSGMGFDNGSSVSKGTTDAGLGGSKGVALKCSLSYELKWDAGRLYTMEQDGFGIRRVDNCGTTTPTATDDSTKGFVVGSLWVLDDGISYQCTNATASSAVWVAHLPLTIGDGLSFNTGTNTISCNTNIARRAGNQTFTGDNTFSGQVELTGQALTNGTSAVTRALGDARYGATYVGIKEENVESTNNTPIKLTSVTLPIGMYQIDCCIAATAAANNGGFVFGLRANNVIKTTLFELYGADAAITQNNMVPSDNLTISQRPISASTLALTNKRQLMGLLEVVTNNTEVSIEFSQITTTPAVPSITRKRSYIIARKIA